MFINEFYGYNQQNIRANTIMTALKKPPIHPLVCAKTSNIHRRGVFAKKFIAEGERIIEYVGEKITKAQSDKFMSSLWRIQKPKAVVRFIFSS